jgi:pimeloyl-ACP methyl ester carboxylesterase
MTAETAWAHMLGARVRYYQDKDRARALEAGSGGPLLLQHAVGGHADAYVRNVVPLARQFHVDAIDLIWHLFSSKPPFTMETIPTFVERVHDFLGAAGIGRAHFEGESLGCWVAARLAIQLPDRVRKIVLNTMAGYSHWPQFEKLEEHDEIVTHFLLRGR